MGILEDHRTIVTTTAIGCGLLAGFYYLKKYNDKKNYWNSEFVPVGEVHQLLIYPVKSCKPIQVRYINCYLYNC